MLEDIEKETKFNDVIGKADEIRFMVEARLTEAKGTRSKLARRLSIEKGTATLASDTHLGDDNNKQSTDSSNSDYFDSMPSEWLTEDNSTNTSNKTNLVNMQTGNKSIKTPTLTLPKFFGVEDDFPEFWAIYDTLVHQNPSLSTIEKMMLLKDSLKGNSDNAIKGVQLIPQNYNRMIESLKKKYGNRLINLSLIHI